MKEISAFSIYFADGQFMIFDPIAMLPAWSDAHTRQGFARRASALNMRALLEFGNADVAVHAGPYGVRAWERVIEVPFLSVSGRIKVDGPEDADGSEHIVEIEPGDYRLVVAQTAVSEERELVHIYFERLAQPLGTSRIVVADSALDPPEPLLEDSDEA